MKQSGKSYQAVRTAPPKPQAARAIKHGWVPSGAKTTPSEQGAWKRSDALKPSPKKSGSGSTSVDPRQMRY
jgi:hypothetical protein